MNILLFLSKVLCYSCIFSISSLHDIWQELNLRASGIPVHGDRKGFKILITSRLESVCSDMQVQKRLEVGILSKDEAWNLFKMTAEISNDTITEVAEEVSQECAGLPLAIVTVGKSLRNKKEHAFRDVLRKLRDSSKTNTSRIQVVIYSCIKSSYDYLESDEHRSLLLLCSLFPEDFEILVEDLVRYARGLFDTFESMAEARDRVEAIIDDLMKCYLILPGEEKKCVKLHDIVRDVCLSIASKSGDVHISFKFGDLSKMLPGLEFQRLRLLRLVNKEEFRKSGFFPIKLRAEETKANEMSFSMEMQELRVLEVNQITISLPSSQQFMTTLRTLSLDHCRLLGDFEGIGSLKMLRVLSFFNSIVDMFPTKIAELINLQCLDLRFHLKCPTTLPLGTLSTLKELEELYLGNSISGDIEILKEVRSLSKLHTFQFVVLDDNCLDLFLNDMNLSELIRFDIARFQGDDRDVNYQIIENRLDLRGKNVHIDLYRLKVLMWRVESFHFDGEGLTNFVDVLGEDNGFPKLKELYLRYCDMKYLVDVTKHLPKGILGKLETLEIRHAIQIEELIHGNYPFGTHQGNFNVRNDLQYPLGNLRMLEIYRCDKLKSFFPKSMVRCLRNLDQIYVQACPIFERIVNSQKDEEEEDCSEVSQFPTLRRLSLNRLPKFTGLGLGFGLTEGFNQVMLPKLEHLNIRLCDSIKETGEKAKKEEVCFSLGCSLTKVRYLDIRECNNLVTIAKFGLLHGFQDLEKLLVSECFSLEVIFDIDEVMCSTSLEPAEITLLGRLEQLELISLPKLKHIWRLLPKKTHVSRNMKVTSVFRNLKELQVRQCGSLRYLSTPTLTNMLVHLEAIDLYDNELMEAIIGRDEMPNDGDEILLGIIVLPKLKSLVVRDLPSFRKLCCCSPELNLELPSLSRLYITFIIDDVFTRDQLSCLTSLTIARTGIQRYPFTPSSAEQIFHIQELALCGDELMEAIMGSHKSDAPKKSIVFPELRKMRISDLRSLRRLCFSANLSLELPSLTELQIINSPVDILTRETRAFQNLSTLVVQRCATLKYLFTSPTAEVLVHLEELVLRYNDSMEAIFENENSDGKKIPNKTIVLPKLRKLEILHLRNLRRLCCSFSVNVDLPSLTQLDIKGCPKMSKLCAGQLIAPQLKNVTYGLMKQEDGLGTSTNSWLKTGKKNAAASNMTVGNRNNAEGCSNDTETKQEEHVDNVSTKCMGKQIVEDENSNSVMGKKYANNVLPQFSTIVQSDLDIM